ncbi:hypothetical protein FQN49_006953 [Arthroderma sp. PD_2]|nr:hypothetical protein FQN49_006953 [Arthroderma sp. PD_2]
MAFDPKLPMDAYVCFSRDPQTSEPRWMLMLMSVGAKYGTLYHSSGGPAHHKPYQVTIEAHKSFDSSGIHATEYLGPIDFPKSNVKRVTGAALRIPAQHSQKYMVGLVAHLEEIDILPEGNAAWLDSHVQMNKRDWDYERQHPVKQREIDYPTPTRTYHKTISLAPPPRQLSLNSFK